MSSNSTSRNEQPHAKQAGKQAGKQAKSEVADDEIGAPRKMAEELRVMEGMTKQLLDTIKGSTNTYGRRHGTGAQIRSLVRGILEQNQSAQASRVKVEQHQASSAMNLCAWHAMPRTDMEYGGARQGKRWWKRRSRRFRSAPRAASACSTRCVGADAAGGVARMQKWRSMG